MAAKELRDREKLPASKRTSGSVVLQAARMISRKQGVSARWLVSAFARHASSRERCRENGDTNAKCMQSFRLLGGQLMYARALKELRDA